MASWIDSIYADSTASFLSNPLPSLGEEGRVRCFADAPVEGVYVRQMVNGAEVYKPMPYKPAKEAGL